MGIKSRLQTKALHFVPKPVMDKVGDAVLKAVDQAVAHRWDRAVRLAGKHAHLAPDAKTKAISRSFRRELAGLGAATGAAAAAPGVGTAAASGIAIADIGWMSMRTADLVMAIGAANGHTEATEAERRAWVLSLLAFGDNAAAEFTSLMSQFKAAEQANNNSYIGAGVRIKSDSVALVPHGGDATAKALRHLNISLAGQIIATYGARTGVKSAGKLLPFGFGMLFGGTSNYVAVRSASKQAAKFFRAYGPPTTKPLPYKSGLPPMPGPEHKR